MHIFAKLESMVRIGRSFFEIDRKVVKSVELDEILSVASTDGDHIVRLPCFGYALKARETIGHYLELGFQICARPACHGETIGGKAWADGKLLLIHRDNQDERVSYFQSHVPVCHRSCSAQISVIGFYGIPKDIMCFAFQYVLHGLLIEVPGRRVNDIRLAIKWQRGQPRFCLDNQINCQKTEGKLQENLLTRIAAIKGLARTACQNRMLDPIVLGAMKSALLVDLFKCRSAIQLGTKPWLNWKRQCFLKSNTVHRDRESPTVTLINRIY